MPATRRLLGIFVVAFVLGSTAPGGTASAAVGVITATPSTGLGSGQTVIVHGSGWVPGDQIGFCQAVPTDPPPGPDACADGQYTLTTADSNGEFSGSLTVQRVIFVPRFNASVDCALPTQTCAVGAADALDVVGTVTTVNIEFALTPPRMVPGGISLPEGNAATTSLPVPVTLSHAFDQTVTAQWTTLFVPGAGGNQADPATDYTPASGTVTFAPNDTTAAATISVNGDTLDEPDEYIVVSFTNPTNARMGGYWGLGFGVITNDEHTRVVPSGATVVEGDSGPVEVNVPVALSNPSTNVITVQWTTLFVPGAGGNQADPATDYTPTSGTVTFAPNDTTAAATISVSGDTLDEPDEYIVVSFTNPTNARMGGYWGLGFGVITNDDTTPTALPR